LENDLLADDGEVAASSGVDWRAGGGAITTRAVVPRPHLAMPATPLTS